MSIEICTASAGSGKTFLLAKNYIRTLLQAPHSEAFAQILAVTFTNKATEEMKTRILGNLHDLAQAGPKARGLSRMLEEETGLSAAEVQQKSARALRAILHNYSRFSVRTLDMFFQRVLRSFVLEAGLGPDFTVDLDLDRLLERSIDRLLSKMADSPAKKHLLALVEEKVKKGGSWSFRSGLKKLGQTAMMESFMRLPFPFYDQLTEEGAVKKMLDNFNLHIRTFQAGLQAYARKILDLWEEGGIQRSDFIRAKSNTIYNTIHAIDRWDKEKVDKGFLKSFGTLFNQFFDAKFWYTKATAENTPFLGIWDRLMALCQEMYDYYCQGLPAYATARSHMEPHGFFLVPYLLQEMQALEEEENNRYIGQTTLLLNRLVQDSDTPFVYEKTGSFYNSFLLDEFQDTSLMQWETLRPLLMHTLSQSLADSLVVGDVKQSIYRWRNGDWTILAERLPRELGFFAPRLSRLAYNYRSSRPVVDFNNQLFPALLKVLSASDAYGEMMESYREPLQQIYAQAAQELPAQAGEEKEEGYVKVQRLLKDDVPEALVNLVADLQDRGFRPKDILILVRKHTDGAKVQEALNRYKALHPHDTRVYEITSVGTQKLSQSPYVQLCMAMFTLALHPQDRLCAAVVARWVESLGPETGVEIPPPPDFYERLTLGTLTEALEGVIRYMRWQHHAPALPYLQELYDCLLDSPPQRGDDLYSFMQWWNEVGVNKSLESENTANVLRMMTIHKAKGLQAPVVIVPYCKGDLQKSGSILWVPSRPPFDALDYLPLKYEKFLEESPYAEYYYHERFNQVLDHLNMNYVALTRAQTELHLFLVDSRKRMTSAPSDSTKKKSKEETSLSVDKLLERGLNLIREAQPEGIWTFGHPVVRQAAQTAGAASANTSPAQTANTEEGASRIYPLQDFASAPITGNAQFSWKEAEPLSIEQALPRQEGIVLHKAFARLVSLADIPSVLRALAQEGLFLARPDSLHRYEQLIREALAHPLARCWFDGSWKVYNEAALLLPADAEGLTRKYRPDRVMEKDGRVVVVDYKFGKQQLPEYRKQIAEYARILREMGHERVEAYLWYVAEGRLERVLA